MFKSNLSFFLALVLCLFSFVGCTTSSELSTSLENESSLVENLDDFSTSEEESASESMQVSDISEEYESVDSLISDGESEEKSESSSVDVSEDNTTDNSHNELSSEAEISKQEPAKDPREPLTPIPETLEVNELDSYFDDSVFIGYSIMMHFGKYISQWKMDIDESIMGDSTFCCGVGMNFTRNRTQTPDTPNNALPRYQGEAYNFEDLPKATNSTSMYIGLMVFSEMKWSPTADYISYAINETINGIEKIQRENPDLNIVILSGTYNTGTYATGELNPNRENNTNVRLINQGVLDYCNEKSIDFIDVSTPLLDGRGFMPVKYASDRDYHIKKNTFKIWIDIFRDYAEKKQNGTWKNIETMPPLVKE